MLFTYRYTCKKCHKKQVLSFGSSAVFTLLGLGLVRLLTYGQGINFFISLAIVILIIGVLAIIFGRYSDPIK